MTIKEALKELFCESSSQELIIQITNAYIIQTNEVYRHLNWMICQLQWAHRQDKGIPDEADCEYSGQLTDAMKLREKIKEELGL